MATINTNSFLETIMTNPRFRESLISYLGEPNRVLHQLHYDCGIRRKTRDPRVIVCKHSSSVEQETERLLNCSIDQLSLFKSSVETLCSYDSSLENSNSILTSSSSDLPTPTLVEFFSPLWGNGGTQSTSLNTYGFMTRSYLREELDSSLDQLTVKISFFLTHQRTFNTNSVGNTWTCQVLPNI